jgi:hypothetical protein
MAHDINNPRTRRYSEFKSLVVGIELFFKKGFYLFFVFINFVIHTRKPKYINIGKYEVNDARFINFVFVSLKENYNFSYDISFSLLNFIKKIGLINFMLHSTPNKLIRNKKKIRLLINSFDKIKDNEINFNTNYFSKKKFTNSLYLPYYIYPKVYNKFYPKLEKFSKNKKKIRIFFSGSTNPQVYGKFNWLDVENNKLLNRIEIINFIIKFYKEKIFFLKKYNDLKYLNPIKTPIVLSINDKLVKKTKTNLKSEEHFDLISKSNFFLTAPGADMPLCHHLIESIKMKSIPISNYAELHQPILDKKFYLQFDNYQSLKTSIDTALNMTESEIYLKQQYLETFYNNFLSPKAFLNKFENRYNNEIISCNDVESLNWLD